MALSCVFGLLAALRGAHRTLAVSGDPPLGAREVAERLGWRLLEPSGATVVVHWKGALGVLPPEPEEVPGAWILVVADAGSGELIEGWEALLDRPARRFLSLNAWFAGLGRRLGVGDAAAARVGSLLRRAGVARVVGSRMCGLKSAGVRHRVFARPGSPPTKLRHRPADRLRDACMSFLGIGHLPLFAANFASLATVLLMFAADLAGGGTLFYGMGAFFILSASAAGVVFEDWSERFYFAKDAREVVIDEVGGMALTLLFLPADRGIGAFLLAFAAFRFFDIFKFGVHWIEERDWPGTVVWDDLLAGGYAGAATLGALALLS